ncbi:MAG: tetratricopeptide repeat protein, partial [Odoribacter sp.]|nr:tetratricopeptide repeat protein [Odoribacter sp.]
SSENPDIQSAIDLLTYYYGYAGYLIEQKQNQEAAKYVEKAEKLNVQYLNLYSQNPSLMALQASFTALRIGMDSFKSITLGPKYIRMVKNAFQVDTNNIYTLTEKGIMHFNSPRFVGGNKTLGLQYLRKAINQMEKEGDTKDNWYYLFLYMTLGDYYEKTGKKKEALDTYQKLLSIEPDFKQVKEKLIPELVE